MTKIDFAAFDRAVSDLNSPEGPRAVTSAPTAAGASPSVAGFVAQVEPLARRVGEKLGVDPAVLIGQWGLETGWGKSVIPGTNNLGNIKDFSGAGTAATDNATGSRDRYRQYASLDAFGDDYSGLIGRRYKDAIGAGDDAERFASALKAGGYAEDPHYVSKLVSATNMVRGAKPGVASGAPAAAASGGSRYDELMRPNPLADWEQFDVSQKEAARQAKINNEGMWDAAKHGFGEATRQIPQLLAGTGAALGDVVGWDTLRDAGLAYVQKSNEEAAAEARPYASFTEAMESGDLARWLAYATGYGVNQIGQSLVTGGVGSIIGKAGLTGLLKGTAQRVAAQALERGATREAAVKAGALAAEVAARKYGAAIGLYSNSFVQELGSIYPDAVEQSQKTGDPLDMVRVLGSSAAAAVLEAAPEVGVAGKVLDGVGKGSAKMLGRAAVNVPKQMGLEGGTEYAQTGFEQWGAQRPTDTPEAERERIDSAAMGAVMGGPMGVVESIPAPKPEQAPAPRPNSPLANAANTAQANGAVPPVAPAGGATPAAQSNPAARLAELEAITKGTPDQTVAGPDGKPLRVPGTPGRFFTQDEADEYRALKGQMSGEAAGETSTPAATNAEGTAADLNAVGPDRLAPRLAKVKSLVEDKELLRALRADSRFGKESVTELLAAYNIARNVDIDPQTRERALSELEQFTAALVGPNVFGGRQDFTMGGSADAQGATEGHEQPPASGVDPLALTDDSQVIDGEFREFNPALLEPESAVQARRDAEAAYEQAFQDLVKAEQLGASDVELQAKQQAAQQAEARLREIQEAIEANRAKDSAARRRAVLDAILADPETANPLARFQAELNRQGFRDSSPTADELAAVARFEDLRATPFPEAPAVAPAAQPKTERAAPAAPAAKPVAPRPSVEQIKQAVADGATLDGKTLVTAAGERIALDGPLLAAARNALNPQLPAMRPIAAAMPGLSLAAQENRQDGTQDPLDGAGQGDAGIAVDREEVAALGSGEARADTALQVGDGAQSARQDAAPEIPGGNVTSEPAEFEHNGTRIYPLSVRVGDEVKAMWGVESAENRAKRLAGERHGFGDSLHETPEQAHAAADRERKGAEDRAAWERKQEKARAQQQAEEGARKADTINGFLTGKTALQAGKAREALAKQYRFADGAVRSVRQHIEALLASGELEVSTFEEDKIKPMSRAQFNRATQREQDAHEKKMREAGKKTVYLVNGSELGKTAYDYAQHLLSAQSPAADQNPIKNESPANAGVSPETAAADQAPVKKDDALDAELQDALSHLGDVLGDVFGTQLKITGQEYGAKDLLPALSKVVELLVRKGMRSFRDSIGATAKAMRANAATAQYVDQISPRQWKAAYQSIAEFHEGTDSEEAVSALSADDVKAVTGAAPTVPPRQTSQMAVGEHSSLEKHPDVPVIDVDASWLDGLPPDGMRDAAMRRIQETFARNGGYIPNTDSGVVMTASNKGIAHAANLGQKHRPFRPHFALASRIDDIIRSAVLAESYTSKKDEGPYLTVHRLYAPVRIDGKLYRVKMTAKQSAKDGGSQRGAWYYDHEATELEEMAPAGRTSQPGAVVTGLGAKRSLVGERSISVRDLLSGVNRDTDGKPFFSGKVEPKAEIKSEIDAAAHEAATSPLNDLPQPTESQIEAGNYKMGHVRVQGLGVTIENPRGSVRSGVSPDGTRWENTLAHSYGYFKGTKAGDGDNVDVFLTDGAETAPMAWVIDQKNKDGSFDELKVVLGPTTEAEARAAYLANYTPGWDGLGAITSMPMEAFKAWISDGKTKRKPLAYVEPKAEQSAPFEKVSSSDFAQIEEGRGALVIQGDPAALKERLDNIGVKFVARKTGVSVPKRDAWPDVRAAIPVRIEQYRVAGVPARLADVTVEVMGDGSARLLSPVVHASGKSADALLRQYVEGYADAPAEDAASPLDEVAERVVDEAPAVHVELGEMPEPVTPPVIAASLRESARNTPFDAKKPKSWLLAEIDDAIVRAGKKNTELSRELEEARTAKFRPSEHVQKLPNSPMRDKLLREERDVFDSRIADAIAKTSRQIGFVTFDVPGDGKFKVVNTVEKLQAFRDKVKSSPGFSEKPTRPMSYGASTAGGPSLDQAIADAKKFGTTDDALAEIGNAIEIARLKKSKDEDKLLDRFREASGGKDYDAWRADVEAAEEVAQREAEERRTRAEQDAAEGEDAFAKLYEAELAQAGEPAQEVAADSVADEQVDADAPPSEMELEGELDKVPAAVQDRVGYALTGLRSLHDRLSGVERARGKGYILSLEVRDVQPEIKRYRDTLDEFRSRAPGNNVDADLVIRAMGGEPDFSVFGDAARGEYPFGRVDREDQFFGSRVRVLPELRSDSAWEGTVGSILNGGRLLEVTKDGADFSVRVGGDRVEVLDRVERGERSEPVDHEQEPVRGDSRPSPGRYVQPRSDGSVQQQKAMASRGGQIATLLQMNEVAGKPYSDDEIQNVADDRIDAVRDYLVGRYNEAKKSAQTPAGLEGSRRDPTKVSAFTPYVDGDIVTIDGKDWQVKQDMPGWYLTSTGDWRGTHPTIQRIKAMNDLIREVEQAAQGSDSSLNRESSWVIRNKQTGEVVMETFDKKKVDALNTEKYEAVPILKYLQEVAAAAKQDASVADEGGISQSADSATSDDLLTPEQARGLMSWEDLGQRDNVKRMRLAFYESAEDRDAKRGAMNYGTIESYQGGKWNIDGTTYPTLKAAKAAAVEKAIERLRSDGYVKGADQSAEAGKPADVDADPVAEQWNELPEQERYNLIRGHFNRDTAAALRLKGWGALNANEREQARTAIDRQGLLVRALTGGVVSPEEYPTKEVEASFSHVSHSAGDGALVMRNAFLEVVQGEYEAAAPLAETPEQKAALDGAIADFKRDYLAHEQGVNAARSGSYSGLVAGGSKLDTAQVDRRNGALDRSAGDFAGWLRSAKGRVKEAVLAARNDDQRAAEQQAKDDKAAKRAASERELIGKLLDFKKGDEVKFGTYPVAKVSFGKDGYPTSVTVDATDLTDNKFDLARTMFGGDKEKLRAVVDAVRAGRETAPDEAQEAAAPKTGPYTLAEHADLIDRIEAGTVSLDEYRQAFERFKAHQAELKAELEGLTKAKIMEAGRVQSHWKNEPKDKLVRFAMGNLWDSFVLSDTISYAFGAGAREAAVERHVAEQTPEKMKTYADKVQERRAEYKARLEEHIAGIENPQTVGAYRDLIRLKGLDALTPEQRRHYEDLLAEQSMAERAQQAERQQAQRTTVAAAEAPEGLSATPIVKGKHTKLGHDLWITNLNQRVDRDVYASLLAQARKLGGDYSSYRGNGAVPGWQFKTEEGAQAFVKLVEGDTSAANQVAAERQAERAEEKSGNAIERLNAMADKIEAAANEELGRDRRTNTARQARMASGAEAAARAQLALARTMRNLAGAIESGAAKFLGGLKTRAQVEQLLSAVKTAHDEMLREKYPNYGDYLAHQADTPTEASVDKVKYPAYDTYVEDMRRVAEVLSKRDGSKAIGNRLMKAVNDTLNEEYAAAVKADPLKFALFKQGTMEPAIFGTERDANVAIIRSGLAIQTEVHTIGRGKWVVTVSRDMAIEQKRFTPGERERVTLRPEFAEEVLNKVEAYNAATARPWDKITLGWWLPEVRDRRKRLQAMNLHNGFELRAALRELLKYQHQIPEGDKVKELERKLIGSKVGVDFFPTPKGVAADMVERAGIEPGMSVLEPSAGNGNIAEAIREAGVVPDTIELSSQLAEILEAKGFPVIASDFKSIEPRKTFTYGDVFRNKDGRLGVMRGSGGMGSGRVGFYPVKADGSIEERNWEWVDRDDLEGVQKRGTESGYDRIVMNPPFGGGADIEHVRHAFELLRPGGRIVAIVGEGAFTRSDKQATAFREWLDELGADVESLPENTFRDPTLMATTGANARLVTIDKPGTVPSVLSRQSADVEPVAGIGVVEANRALAALSASFPVAPRTVLVDRFEDLPEQVQRDAKSQEANEKSTKGAFHDGVLYVVRENHRSVADFQATLAHEMLGHFGLREELGPEFVQKANQLFVQLGGVSGLSRIAHAHKFGAEFAEYVRGVAAARGTDPRFTEEIAKLVLTEEVYAHLAERRGGAWAKLLDLVGRLRHWIREKGWAELANLNDADVLAHLWRIERLLGKPGPEGGPRGGKTPAVLKKGDARAQQTDTAAFREWFGDSKVVDASGKPLVVYHGTLHDIEAFDGSRFYFTPDATYASGYADADEGGGNVMPVYLSLQRPLDLTEVGSDTRVSARTFIQMLGAKGITSAKLRDHIAEKYSREVPVWAYMQDSAVTEALQAAGFDGVVQRESNGSGTAKAYIAFRPEQVKSAVGNRGTFDPSNPSIMASRKEASAEQGMTPEQFRSALVDRFGEAGVASLEAQGLLNIVEPNDPEVGGTIDPNNLAWYDPNTGYAFFVPSFIVSPEQAVAMVLHEVGEHHGLASMIGERGWRALKGRIVSLAREKGDVRAAWDGVIDNYPEFAHLAGEAPSVEVLSDRFMHEIIAKLGEAAAGRKSSLWRDILTAVNRFLLKMGLARQINKNELADLVAGSLARVMREEGVRVGSQGAALTDSGDSGRMDQRPFSLADYTGEPEGRSAIRSRLASAFDAAFGGESVKTFNWWNRTVGSQFQKAKQSREFKRVYDIANDFISDVSRFANRAADQARGILPHLDTFKDIGRGLNVKRAWAEAKDYQAIAPAIFEGTLVNGTTGKVWTDRELRDRFDLNEQQIAYYREFRAAVDHSLDALAASEMARSARAAKIEVADPEMSMDEAEAYYSGQLDEQIEQAREALEELALRHEEQLRAQAELLRTFPRREAVEEALQILAERQQEERARIESQISDLEKLRDTFADKAARTRQLQSQGYAPLMRFGRYTVDVVALDENGEPAMNRDGEPDRPFFGMFETEAEAREAATLLAQEYPDYVVRRGVLSETANQLYKGITPETAEMFARLLGTDQEGAFQAYLKQAVANRSAMKRLIERKGMAGFAQDVPRVLASFITSNARLSAGNWHFGEMMKAAEAIPREQGDVKDEAVRLIDYIQNPQEEAAGLRGLLFFNFLGGSIASAAVNLTQSFSTTLPYLAQFGARRAGAALASAMATSAKIMKSGDYDMISDRALREAMQRAADEGIVDPQEIHLLMAESGGSGASGIAGSVAGLINKEWAAPASRVARALTQGWGSLFSAGEKYNRHVAFLAAWEMAPAGVDRYTFAKDAVTETQFQYTKANRPNWARGAVGATLFTFKTFIINYLEFLSRLPTRERAIAVGVLLLLSGLSGAPGADDLDDLIDAIGQKMGYNWNNAAARHAFLADTFGQGATNFIEHGVSSFLPIDVSARLGAGNLIPGTEAFKKSSTDKSRDAAEFFGPAGSLAAGAFKVLDSIGSGKDFDEIIKPIAPKTYNDAWQAIDMLQTGYYRDSRGRKVVEADAFDAFMKGIGFQPNAVAEPRRVEWMIAQSSAMHRAVRADLNELWARGVFEKDADKVALAREMLANWNRKNPTTPIHVNPDSIAQRVRAMRASSADRMVKATSRDLRGMIREELKVE